RPATQPPAGPAEISRHCPAAGARPYRRGRGPHSARSPPARCRPRDQALQPDEAHPAHRHDVRRLAAGDAVSTWAAILAGGSGTRFWPLSTPEQPKQFLPLAGNRPLLADWAVADDSAVRAAATQALGVAAEQDVLVTVGIKPTRNETAYGYIVPGRASGSARKVKRFIEKPSPTRAALLRRGGALW